MIDLHELRVDERLVMMECTVLIEVAVQVMHSVVHEQTERVRRAMVIDVK